MATSSPPTNQQPTVNCSPPQASVPSPPLPIEYAVHHHQFTNSISPSSPPQLPENSPDQQEPPPVLPSPPPEDKFDYQQPLPPSPPPPPIATEQPPENFSPEYPLSKQHPSPSRSPSPSPPPTAPEDPVEIPDYHHINPNPTSEHESTLSKQPPSSGPDDPEQSPNPNPHLDHESPSLSSPVKLQIYPNPKPNESALETLTPPLGVPILHVAASSSPNKPQISPWTHQETANLIQAYQEKWYSLKKGPLKAGQWEEVAITVAARCGYDEPTKTSKQCRHKLEKLRKRYRAERAKPRSKATAWNFFKLMDNLEKGPLPISSSQSMALVEYQKPSSSNGKKRKNNNTNDDDDDDDDGGGGDGDFLVNKRSSSSSRAKNYTHYVPDGYLTRNLRFSEGGNRVVRGLRTPVVHKHKGFYQEDEEEEEEEEQEEEGGDNVSGEGVAAQLAVEIKGFAEKFVKMENKKIEMIRDVERYRLEMENKRMEMILESQQMLVETVNNAFSSFHKLSAN